MSHLFATLRQTPPSSAARRRTGGRIFGVAAAFALLLAAGLVSVRADAQERELLNRLVQSSTAAGSDAAMKAFVEGRNLIDEEKWARAADRFNRFINEYPTDKYVDAAYFYLAYSHWKLNKYQDADNTLSRLISTYPRSSWVDDAKKLKLQVSLALDPKAAEQAAKEADVEIKIIALQSLCQSEPTRCSTLINDVLNSGSPVRLKEAAITLLGRYGGAQAVPSLLNIARGGSDMNLRIKAIAALGRIKDESVLEPLREQAMMPEFTENGIVDTALHAIARHESPRAVNILGDLGMNAKTLEGRKHAIYLLSTQRKGEAPVDELFRIFDADQNIEIRKQVVSGFGSRISERAGERLVQIARTSPNTELRGVAIRAIAQRSRSIPNRNTESDLEVLISLYDSERDDELKDTILSSISHYESKRATQKLMEIVRSNAPVERRKHAISALSKSKDPDVLRFLEDILK